MARRMSRKKRIAIIDAEIGLAHYLSTQYHIDMSLDPGRAISIARADREAVERLRGGK